MVLATILTCIGDSLILESYYDSQKICNNESRT